MLSRNQEYQPLSTSEPVLSVTSDLVEELEEVTLGTSLLTPTQFYSRHQDSMTMYAPATAVAEYLNTHSCWFTRCAEPMKVQPLGENGYALVIGHYGAFGYNVEPKIGLELLPPESGVYRIRTIPIPDYQPPGYDVDYRASLQLVESKGDSTANFSGEMTLVEWELDLTVNIHFPKFIQRLPKSLIQSTGDRLLNQIIRQVSRRLTRKVQVDFHRSLDIPFPLKSHKHRSMP
ncbi:MAG: DUF1997 domain-containing protein [Nostocaceae cyanobacterium]|nr:DUF1997 domain-containing protein [Nostocaceae cyanobacterium]